jgi:hypothetical protein
MVNRSLQPGLGLVAVALAALGSGCGGGAPTRTLTATSVSNLPPGDATGTGLSGTYLITSSTIEGCDCRVGSCGFFHGQSGGTLTAVQQGGSLTMTPSSGSTTTGGVDADGTFSAGGSSPIPYSVGQGEEYVLETGRFQVSGGVPAGVTFQAYETITGTLEGASYDCDLVVALTARYEYGGGTTHQLLGGSAALDIPAGGCAIVNNAPETLPASTMSFSVTDGYNDSLSVFVIPSSYACQLNPSASFIANFFTGSGANSGPVPAGTYDLDIICGNTTTDCLLSSVTWEATY